MRPLLLVALLACHPQRPHLALVTTGEASAFTKTGHYDEVIRLCDDFATSYEHVTCDRLGQTYEGREIVALHIMRDPARPTIFVQAGIHAGEIEGKDAGFWFFRDLLDGKVAPGALGAVNIVFIPCVNPDGHERFGPNNRPNQRGPVEMGFRTDAARFNINRDFVKADSYEMKAILRVFREENPLVFVDIHTTDGAKFQHDVSLSISPRAPRADQLDRMAQQISDALVSRMTALGHKPVTFYPSFLKDDDPTSGFAVGEAPPRFSQAYAGARSRFGILVENHSWRTYRERVQSSYDMLRALFEKAVTDVDAWDGFARTAQLDDQELAGHELPLVWGTTDHTTEIEFAGYAYEKRPSDISGGTWIVYDESKPEIWKIPLHDELVAKVTTKLPQGGYVIEGGYTQRVAEVLDRHGISYIMIGGQPRLDVDVFRATKVTTQPLFEGRARMQFEGAWTREKRTLERNSMFVSLHQPNARLIVHLLDPAGPDSLAQWGEFATAFERKEYMESYVAEQLARDMLERDPALGAQFDAALAADPALAASPEKRLDWFYQRSLAWDERTNLLPVYRSDVDLRISDH